MIMTQSQELTTAGVIAPAGKRITAFQLLAPKGTVITIDDSIDIVVYENYYVDEVSFTSIKLKTLGPKYALAVNNKIDRIMGFNNRHTSTSYDIKTGCNFGFPPMIAYNIE